MIEYLNIAKEAVILARKKFDLNKDRVVVNSSIGKDIKLQLDIDIEKTLIKNLKSNSDFDILGEESGLIKGSSDKKFRWIIDPIVGTLNFSRGIPFYCISVALWDGDSPVLGVIHDLSAGKCYTGIVNIGAWCDDKPIMVSNINDIKKSIICTGFPVYSSFDDKNLNSFIKELQSYKKVRLFGSAAMSLVMVSKGSAEVYKENTIALWDVAAGIAINLAAGGYANFEFQNEQKYLLDVICHNNKLNL